jgi:hypothetical protein
MISNHSYVGMYMILYIVGMHTYIVGMYIHCWNCWNIYIVGMYIVGMYIHSVCIQCIYIVYRHCTFRSLTLLPIMRHGCTYYHCKMTRPVTDNDWHNYKAVTHHHMIE